MRDLFVDLARELGVADPQQLAVRLNLLYDAGSVNASFHQEQESARRMRMMAEMMVDAAAVDAAFQEWHDGQPDCWAEMRDEARRQGWTFGTGSGVAYGAGVMARPAMSMNESRDAAPAAKKKSSGTNNQIANVDEADIVKTDGRYMYLAANGALRIFDAQSPKELSVTHLAGGARELFVEGDRAVVYSSTGATRPECTYAYDCQVAGDGSTTQVTVFDIAKRDKPVVKRRFALSGSLMAARRTGNIVHTVVADGDGGAEFASYPEDYQSCGEVEKSVRAKFAKLRADNERKIRAHASRLPTIAENGGTPAPMCSGLLRTEVKDGDQFTTLVSFDLANDKVAPTTASMQSRPGTVFASDSGLYIAVTHPDEQASEIHRFAIGDKPSDTKYAGNGRVPGHVLNQFAMDEWNGYLRVATTKGRVPDPAVESEISILAKTDDGALTRVGAFSKIAPGEDIRAVRFDDDRAYVVTFKKTDPLFVIDTVDPQAPKILGELKIPGFSTYIHRIDPNHLLSIGFDANDHGDFAYFDGVLLQLFDVEHSTDPRLLWKEKIGTRGSSSEAATNHLAFNYFADEKLLALPMTICAGGSDGVNGQAVAFSGLLVYDVDIEHGFKRLGGVDHGKQGANCTTWWSNANSAVKRSVFVDDLVYSIAGDRIKVQRKTKLGTDVADLTLDD